MIQLYLDIREDSLAILIHDGNKVCRRLNSTFDSLDDLRDKVKLSIKDSGLKPDIAHIIIPPSEVIVENITLQNMPVEYAELIIRRKIINERGLKDPLFHLTLLRSERLQQIYMVEVIEKEKAEGYIKILSSSGINVRTLTTAFQANLVSAKEVEKDIGTFGILDIGNEFMEFTIISNSVPILHERVSLQRSEKDESIKERQERFDRIALFKIAEKFHHIYKRSKSDLTQNFSKVFLCGHLCVNRELIDILSEIVEIETLKDSEGDESCLYTSLKGLVRGASNKGIANFLERKRKSLSFFLKRYRRPALVAMIAYILVLAVGFYYVETKYRKTLLRLDLETKALSQRAKDVGHSGQWSQLMAIPEKDIPLYELMKYLANNLPDGIFLEKINYIGTDKRVIIELNFMIKDATSIGREALLTRLIKTLDGSVYLKRHAEPAISIETKDKNRNVRIQLVVEAF